MELINNFEGSFSFILAFPSGWESMDKWNLKQEYPCQGGKVVVEANNKPEVICTFFPESGTKFYLKSPPIIFKNLHEMAVIVTWKEQEAQVWINRTKAASTDLSFVYPEFISVNTTPRNILADTESYKIISEEKRVSRIQEARDMKGRLGTRPRSLKERIDALNDKIGLLSKYISEISNGDHRHYVSIATILRSIICTSERGPSYPLLQRVAGMIEQPLTVYSNPREIASMLDSTVCQYEIFLSVSADSRCATEMDLDCWLDLKHILIKEDGQTEKKFSNNNVIKCLADTEAAHLDDDIVPLVDKLSPVFLSENENVRSLYTEHLIQIAKVVIYLANELVHHYYELQENEVKSQELVSD